MPALQAPLACAAADPATVDESRRLRSLADGLACKLGVQAACAP